MGIADGRNLKRKHWPKHVIGYVVKPVDRPLLHQSDLSMAGGSKLIIVFAAFHSCTVSIHVGNIDWVFNVIIQCTPWLMKEVSSMALALSLTADSLTS